MASPAPLDTSYPTYPTRTYPTAAGRTGRRRIPPPPSTPRAPKSARLPAYPAETYPADSSQVSFLTPRTPEPGSAHLPYKSLAGGRRSRPRPTLESHAYPAAPTSQSPARLPPAVPSPYTCMPERPTPTLQAFRRAAAGCPAARGRVPHRLHHHCNHRQPQQHAAEASPLCHHVRLCRPTLHASTAGHSRPRPQYVSTAAAAPATTPLTQPAPRRAVKSEKSRRRRAYPQQIVTTRLLYCLQDPFAQLSRLQRI